MISVKNDSNNPYFNLALEEYFMKYRDLGDDILILWQNEPTVVVGRNQNTIEEINSKFIRENNIHVVRRPSGGGTVFHDLGNLNYTFISSSEHDNGNNFRKFTRPVIEVLRTLGINAEFTGRNDITIDGKKICGTAQYYYKNKVLHHGAMLFNANLDVLQDCLNVKLDKIQSKGIKSVRSRVSNIYTHLKEKITVNEFKNLLLKYILDTDDIESKQYILTNEDLEKINQIKKEKYDTWEWNYGESPNFGLQKSKRYAGGSLDLRFDVEGGNIKHCKIFGDFFGTKEISEIEALLVGKKFNEDEVKNTLNSIELNDYLYNITADNFIDCMFFE